MAQPYVIRYQFLFHDGEVLDFTVVLDGETLINLTPLPARPPEWARLGYYQCGNCPLGDEHAYCPTAAHLAELVTVFSSVVSHKRATVRVILPEREVQKETTAQLGLSSLIGVHMTTSGCPVLAKLRPMVRFHLPFATREETVFRSLATYLVEQFVRRQDGHEPDWSASGLIEAYRAIGLVNQAFARRLRHAVEKDANLNALVRLDVLGRGLPDSLADNLADLRYLFRTYELEDLDGRREPEGRPPEGRAPEARSPEGGPPRGGEPPSS